MPAMRLGIDFGTTRVVVAAADRGNYPIVTFEEPTGAGCEWYPALVATRDGEALSGFDAATRAEDPAWQLRRSLKTRLALAGPCDLFAGRPITEALRHFLDDLRRHLLEHSNLELAPEEDLEVAIAVPANATANQRMLTADAFRAAGFAVRRILDEPSAAGLEYAWRRPRDAGVRRRHLAVYDLGGGTFDASVIAMGDDLHEVLSTEGVQRLGGDDFDRVLLELAAGRVGLELPPEGPELDRLLEICREEKERFGPNTRRLTLELGEAGTATVDAEEYEQALEPLIERTLSALDGALSRVAERAGEDLERSTVVYQVGGASALPAVGRALRGRHGRRVWRSPYPHASIAIGLAIAAEEEAAPRIVGRLGRHFGVWRERDEGRGAIFDPIFERDTVLPTPAEPAMSAVRRYRGAHDVAHFRFVEASRLGPDRAPAGDVNPWSEVCFPLDPSLRDRPLAGRPVSRLDGSGPLVEERYTLRADGTVEVEIAHLDAGFSERYDLHGRR